MNSNRNNESNSPRRNNESSVERRENQPRRESYQRPQNNTYEQPKSSRPKQAGLSSKLGNLDKRQKLLLGLGLLGLISTVAGISEMISNAGKVRILQVQNATVTAQQPYQNCGEVATTSYSNYHKNGTTGAIIGGTGGAVVGGLITHSWIGAGVGAVIGGVGGDLVQRSSQPNVVAHHSEKEVCHQAYRPVQVMIGYNVQFMDHDDNVANIVTAHQPPIGDKISLEELQKDQVTEQQQQQIVQQAISGNQQQQNQQGQSNNQNG